MSYKKVKISNSSFILRNRSYEFNFIFSLFMYYELLVFTGVMYLSKNNLYAW